MLSRRYAVSSFVLVTAAVYVALAVGRSPIFLDGFSVPMQYREVGFTAQLCTARVLERIREIEVSTRSRMRMDRLTLSATQDDDIPEFQIPSTNISFKSFTRYIQSAIGREPDHISGEVVLPLRAAELRMKSKGQRPI